MKIFKLSPTLCAAVAGLVTVSASHAQIFPNNVTAPIAGKGTINSGASKYNVLSGDVYNTFTLNVTADRPGEAATKETDTSYQETVKFIKVKISNKEILTAMANDGLISSVSGWSLAAVGGAATIVAVKKGADDVEVPAELLAVTIDEANAVAAYNLSEKTDKQGNTKTTYSESGYVPVAGVIAENLPLAGTADYSVALKTIKVEGEAIEYDATTLKANVSGSVQ